MNTVHNEKIDFFVSESKRARERRACMKKRIKNYVLYVLQYTIVKVGKALCEARCLGTDVNWVRSSNAIALWQRNVQLARCRTTLGHRRRVRTKVILTNVFHETVDIRYVNHRSRGAITFVAHRTIGQEDRVGAVLKAQLAMLGGDDRTVLGEMCKRQH